MEYKILLNGEVIAQFKHQMDRNQCYDIFTETYPNLIFKTKDEVE